MGMWDSKPLTYLVTDIDGQAVGSWPSGPTSGGRSDCRSESSAESVYDEGMPLLVTGFGAFGEFAENPSSLLAAGCGCENCILEVAFEAVDEFLAALDPDSFDALLMLGVAGKAEGFRLETVARNWIGKTPDVWGSVQGPGPLDPAGPPLLAASLWPAWLLMDGPLRGASVDAGDYLCNYAFYRALQAFPEKRVGFLHVPPVTTVPIERQHQVLAEVLAAL